MLSEQAIEAIAAAMFHGADPWVAEAYSDVDVLPLQFQGPEVLAQYVRRELAKVNGSAFLVASYSDMGGRAIRRTIDLTPGAILGHRLRYTWDGWGLISVHLRRGDRPNGASRISANSEVRANKWRTANPGWEPPETWNWKAVARHTRRLQRVLRTIS